LRRSPSLDVRAILAGLGAPQSDNDDAATEAMIEATSHLLSTYGMRRWSMDDVAERAGLARATVYRRFESRDDLVQTTLARHARRFFAVIAEAVDEVSELEDKVVEGLLVGLRVVRSSLIPSLFETDKVAALSLLTAAPVLSLGRAALVQRYEMLVGVPISGLERDRVELVAEALVRLAISFVLIPDSVIDLADDATGRAALRQVITPLLGLRSGRLETDLDGGLVVAAPDGDG
jgi:AcrR family transcriptional regulator